jgi:hypothetical protein
MPYILFKKLKNYSLLQYKLLPCVIIKAENVANFDHLNVSHEAPIDAA